jgi:hypothetical protein
MEIAVTGFNPSFGSAVSADTVRQRPSPSSDRASEQAPREQRNNQAQANPTTRTPQTASVIEGEVLSSETSRVRAEEPSYSFLGRSSTNQQAPNSQPDTRRVSVQQALQNFEQNESLVSDIDSQRQVSGIIDEFV